MAYVKSFFQINFPGAGRTSLINDWNLRNRMQRQCIMEKKKKSSHTYFGKITTDIKKCTLDKVENYISKFIDEFNGTFNATVSIFKNVSGLILF